MKLGDRSLGISPQIWGVLEILAGGDYGFYGLDIEGTTDDMADTKSKNHDVHTYPFYNFSGRAYGFSFIVKHANAVFNGEPVLFFTITEHGACDEICVIDWLSTYQHGNPPMLSKDRPENSRCTNFAFGASGDVMEYVRHLVAYFLAGKAGMEIKSHGIVSVQNEGSLCGKRV